MWGTTEGEDVSGTSINLAVLARHVRTFRCKRSITCKFGSLIFFQYGAFQIKP